MEEIKDYISIGLSPQTFEEVLGTLETQLQSYDILIEKCQSIIAANTNDKGVIKKGINGLFLPLMAYLDTLKNQTQALYTKLRRESGIDTVIVSKKKYITEKGNLTTEMQEIKESIDMLDDAYNDELIQLEKAGLLQDGIIAAQKKIQTNKIVFDEAPTWEM